ncbi:hypothetical protein NPIL_39611 [Nephila pilipes]|uniref:Uncharacterized protein n=1 Tax=Nephila pilipes TaxID=299642 RepID=A0A8X6UJU9_NEPPI|nr:hypothetical protein NPIL_39611 [Nephila pilipes]
MKTSLHTAKRSEWLSIPLSWVPLSRGRLSTADRIAFLSSGLQLKRLITSTPRNELLPRCPSSKKQEKKSFQSPTIGHFVIYKR